MKDTLDLDIRPMQPEDLNSVLAIEAVSFPSPWSHRAYMGELTRNSFAHYFVGLIHGQVICYIGLWIMVDEAHITTIAVAPEYRGNRLAERLIEYAEEYSKVWGAEKMVLEVRVSNEAAQKVYKRLGFETIGLRKRYYSDNLEDAYVMLKRYAGFININEKIT